MKVLFSTLMVLLTLQLSYAQLSTQITTDVNQYSVELCDNCPNWQIAQDLFFSIGPNGIPQYGQNVSWNLEMNTTGKARFYHVRKGDWGRSAIQTATDDIALNLETQNFPTSTVRNANMGADWIKLGQSWNFSHDNYAIAIISFTNQGLSKIDKGTIKFSHEIFPFLSVSEIMVYNEWVEQKQPETILNRKVYEFDYENLYPGEIRYLYIKVDIAKGVGYRIPDTDLRVEMTGFQNASLGIGGVFPPHDPNALTLITAFKNTPPAEGCSAYESIPKLEEACLKGQPFWVDCMAEGESSCPKYATLDYPYCNKDSEELTYRIDCLNEGRGVAKDIIMENVFNLQESPFDLEIFSYSGSHQPILGNANYPIYDFSYDEINLPGLADETHFYTYDECSANAVFDLKTLCNLEVEISAQAGIIFIGSNNEPEPEIFTNTVKIIPQQGVYSNYTPSCESCGFGAEGRTDKYIPNDFQLISTKDQLELTFDREAKENYVLINIIDVSGRINHSLKLAPNGSTSVFETIDVSELSSGIYFMSIQDGSKNYIEKFIHY